MASALAFVLSYLIGSIPTAYILVRWVKGIDIRTVGSGNVGATNTSRALGKKYAYLVFVIDVLKGVLPVLVIAPVLVLSPDVFARLVCGVCAILGHNFPIFLQFRGGKGVATTIGVLVAAMPQVAGICLIVWLGFYAVTRYVSVGSLAAAIVIPIAQLCLGFSFKEVSVGVFLAILIVVRHRENIGRLLRGEENRPGPSKG